MALELRKTKSTNPKVQDAPVIYVQSNNSDPKAAGDETFQAKDILKKAKARWNRFDKRWEWTIMKPEYTDMVINLATQAVDDANEFIQAKAEKIAPFIKALKDIEDGMRGAKGVSTEEVDGVMAKLTSFIRDLQNEVDAVRFDEKIQRYFDFLASSRGYSFNNMVLIMIQDPQSTDVRSKTNWGLVDFEPKPDAPSIIMLRPKTRPKSKAMKQQDLEKFLKQRGYNSTAEMKKADWAKLKVIQNLGIPIGGFAAYQAYDVRHVVSKDPENTERPERPNLKWSEDEPSEQADKIREAMIAAARKLGITVEFKEEMGGAKGMSGSGKIFLLQGHDGIGGLSTMAHELSHEILHQNFLQKQAKEKKSGADEEFLDLYVGRDSTQIIELQAEASAYVVIRNYGMDSKTHANYIVLFRNDRKNIEQNLTIITKVANKVIKLTDANMGTIEETVTEELNVSQVAKMLGIKMPNEMNESVRNQIRKHLVKEFMQNDPQDYPWYCQNCDEELQWFDVTYEETHNACGEPVVPNMENDDEEERMDSDMMMYEKGDGLWANIRAKRARGEKPAKPGDEDYPDAKAWKKAQNEELTQEEWDEANSLLEKADGWEECKPSLEEAEYQGRKVKLNKPMKGDVKKFKVYVKNDKGNVVKVNFGQKGVKIKKNNPERRKSFRARHNCDNPGPKWKARYWSCRKW